MLQNVNDFACHGADARAMIKSGHNPWKKTHAKK